ncbi:transcriptional regulator, AbrB family [Desulfofundulus kuznetsovii DSM 6115]|uniref:Transcriptional regulator, AbrB family n=2 Tax=Desulfofundulus kuznetsovii TaxID=58135 RepID=A0AAU8PGW2_DESK7|nr:transcriptional regulator, AbrB family [Desulfofundulus kuznetsovii DSM 6115]
MISYKQECITKGMIIMNELYIARITTKGQVTLPLELRKFLNIKKGDYILFEKKGSRVEIKKMVPPHDFDDFARPIRERFKREGITPDDVEAAIKWARGVTENHRPSFSVENDGLMPRPSPVPPPGRETAPG